MGVLRFAGGKPDMAAPISGILASDLAVGSVVKMMENGTPVEYLVVNQGKPSGSSLYDDSCDGLWLLRKDIKEKRQWHSSNVNNYKNSTIHSYLNSTFLNLFDSSTRSIIKQIKIPYVNGTGTSKAVASGDSGLSTKVFLLSVWETGWDFLNGSYDSIIGAKLSYFESGYDDSAINKRVGYLNGTATDYWMRDPASYEDTTAGRIVVNGGDWVEYSCTSKYGVRPTLILPSTALFDEETLILKGVA